MSEERDPIWQTHAPHVEFYISVPDGAGGVQQVDILRDSQGRPRTLLSFSHTITSMGDGPFRIEVFDPNYVEIEELLLTFRQAVGGSAGEDGDKPKFQVTNHCLFRYGYVSEDGRVLSGSPHGEKYFAGALLRYTPTMQTNGTTLVIEGMSSTVTGADLTQKIRIDSSWQSKPIYSIVADVCMHQGWELKGLGAYQLERLPLHMQPEVILDSGQSLDSTEEQERTIKIYGEESPYDLVQRMCMYARTVDPKFGQYTTYLQYYVSDVNSNPKGYLYFGPHDPTQDPVRRYIYMRDKHSEVISFSPTVMGIPGYIIGSAGMNVLTDDVRHGTMEVDQLSETDNQLKYHNDDRPPVAQDHASDGPKQEGTPQLKNGDEKKVEGTSHGGNVLAPSKKIPPDAPTLEMAGRTDNRYFMDREAMNYWATCQNQIQQASIEIFGDPGQGSTSALDIGKLVDVFVFTPQTDGTFKVHYVSNRWQIVGLVHQISGGTYITSMELLKNGFNAGGVSSDQQFISLMVSLEKAVGKGMKKVSK